MRYTLKEMVDLILNAMDSDEVNSITDTVEATDIANTIKSCYYDMATDLDLPEHNRVYELNASGDNAKPVLMTLPNNALNLKWLKYDMQISGDTVSDYQYLDRLDLENFMLRQEALREYTSDVDEMIFTSNSESFPFMYWTDRHPSYYTTFDDNTLLFDAHDSTLDTTLQKSKTMAFGNVYPAFTIDDDFIPEIDPSQFSLLINKAKVRCFAEKKQAANPEAMAEMRRQRIIVQKRQRSIETIPELHKHARFGRK